MMDELKSGDRCPACGGKGRIFLEQDAHRSEGWIPCGFNTTRNGLIDGRPVKFIALQCHKGLR